MDGLAISCSGAKLRSIICVIKGRAIFKELLSVTTSVSQCLGSKILESLPKLSKILTMMKHCKKMSVMKHF